MAKVRRIEFEFVDRGDGSTEVTAKGTAFKWGDLSAIVAFGLDMMESYNLQARLCNDAKYGKENN